MILEIILEVFFTIFLGAVFSLVIFFGIDIIVMNFDGRMNDIYDLSINKIKNNIYIDSEEPNIYYKEIVVAIILGFF